MYTRIDEAARDSNYMQAVPPQSDLRAMWVGTIKPFVVTDDAVVFRNTKAVTTQCQKIVGLKFQGSINYIGFWMYGQTLDDVADYIVYPKFPMDIQKTLKSTFMSIIGAIEIILLGDTNYIFGGFLNTIAISGVMKTLMSSAYTVRPRIYADCVTQKNFAQYLFDLAMRRRADADKINAYAFDDIDRRGNRRIVPPARIYLGDVQGVGPLPDKIETSMGTYFRVSSLVTLVVTKEIYPTLAKNNCMQQALGDGRIIQGAPENWQLTSRSYIVEPQLFAPRLRIDPKTHFFHEDCFREQIQDKLTGTYQVLATQHQFALFKNTAYLRPEVFLSGCGAKAFQLDIKWQIERENSERLSQRPDPDTRIDRVVCVFSPTDPDASTIAGNLAKALDLPAKTDPVDVEDKKDDESMLTELEVTNTTKELTQLREDLTRDTYALLKMLNAHSCHAAECRLLANQAEYRLTTDSRLRAPSDGKDANFDLLFEHRKNLHDDSELKNVRRNLAASAFLMIAEKLHPGCMPYVHIPEICEGILKLVSDYKREFTGTPKVTDTDTTTDILMVGGNFGNGTTHSVAPWRTDVLGMVFDQIQGQPAEKLHYVLNQMTSPHGLDNLNDVMDPDLQFRIANAITELMQTGNWFEHVILRNSDGRRRFISLFQDIESNPGHYALMLSLQKMMESDMTQAYLRDDGTTQTFYGLGRDTTLTMRRISTQREKSTFISLGKIVFSSGFPGIEITLQSVGALSGADVWKIIRENFITNLFISDANDAVVVVNEAVPGTVDGRKIIETVSVKRLVSAWNAIEGIALGGFVLDLNAIVKSAHDTGSVYNKLREAADHACR